MNPVRKTKLRQVVAKVFGGDAAADDVILSHYQDIVWNAFEEQGMLLDWQDTVNAVEGRDYIVRYGHVIDLLTYARGGFWLDKCRHRMEAPDAIAPLPKF